MGCGHESDRMIASRNGNARDMNSRVLALAGAAVMAPLSPLSAQQAGATSTPQSLLANVAQETQAPASQSQMGTAPGAIPDDAGDEEEIVIKGTRQRGSVVGDIPPEVTLDSRDVLATGASNISALLDAIAPQIGSVRGRGDEQPVLLLNGLRISSVRELRDTPTEAVLRVDILPEEVALKYGYRADQKVVNIVLRRRFRSTKVEVAGGGATDGGYTSGNGDLTRFLVQRQGRTTLNLHALVNSMLTESEREITLDQTPLSGTTQQQLAARSLIGSKRDIRASGTFNRQLSKIVSGTLNTEIEHVRGRSFVGLNPNLLQTLVRMVYDDTAHAGLSFNGQTRSQWRWTVTGNADLASTRTSTDRSDPGFQQERSHETAESGDLTATANGRLLKVPAGYASTTLTIGGSERHLESSRTRPGASVSTSVSRTTDDVGINLDLPISRRGEGFAALGNLTLNGNAVVDHLSDFGTLITVGAGVNWTPLDRLTFIASWTRDEGAPSMNQLGDPVLDTPRSRIFDFTTGQTVLVDAITGGNPNLLADRRTILKLSGNWQPLRNTDLRLRADYVHQIIAGPISNISATPQIEAAFPDRFVRTASGHLVSVNFTPVNFDRSQRDQLRVGFDFTKALKSHQPSQSILDQMRAAFGFGKNGASGIGIGPSAPVPAGGIPASRGRVQLSVTDTITFTDKARITPGGAELDFLHGGVAGPMGGTPRHDFLAQLGYFNNGLGARIGASWRSATTVDVATGNDLHFSPFGTLDLRFFAKPGDIPELVLRHPWLRRTQIRLEINNVFNSRPRVHDQEGNVPLAYQPDLLEPLGRTIMISVRKLFQPAAGQFRQELRVEPGRAQQQQSSR